MSNPVIIQISRLCKLWKIQDQRTSLTFSKNPNINANMNEHVQNMRTCNGVENTNAENSSSIML